MSSQIFKNNFDWAFIGPVTASTHVGYESTIGKGILQISDAASAILGTLTGGDWYILTGYKRSGSVESSIEIVKVLGVNEIAYAAPGECRIRVERGAEGTTPQTYVAGDLISMRLTAGGLNDLASDAEVATALALKANLASPTLTTPVLTNPSYSGATANGGTVTTIDINGGTIDGAVIGSTAPAAGSFTTVSASGNVSLINPSTNQLELGLQDITGRRLVLKNPTPSFPAYVGTSTNHDTVLGHGTGLTEIARVSSTGLSVTGTLSVPQITFPATQVPSADVNTLDDYEEGTWTPTQGAGLTVVGSFVSSGSYVKIGKQVTIWGRISGSTSIASAGNTIACGGLPFAAAVNGLGIFTNNYINVNVVAYAAGGNVYSSSFSATPQLDFTITYTV